MTKTRILIAAILLIASSSTVSAVVQPKLGIKAGMAVANQQWEYNNILGHLDRNHSLGFAAGVFADLSPTSMLGIRPELLYVQKGSSVKVHYATYTGHNTDTETLADRVDYMSLSLDVKLAVGHGPLGYYAFCGPRLDVKLSTRTDVPGEDIQGILDSYNSTVTGLTFGLGLQRALGKLGPVMIEARYDYDFQEAARYVGSEATLVIDNKALMVLVGLTF
jgi:hypothetical protein